MLNKCFASDNWIANQIFLLREQGALALNQSSRPVMSLILSFKNDCQACRVFSVKIKVLFIRCLEWLWYSQKLAAKEFDRYFLVNSVLRKKPSIFGSGAFVYYKWWFIERLISCHNAISEAHFARPSNARSS